MKTKITYLIIAILSVLLGAGVLSFYFYPAFQFQVCRMWFAKTDPGWPDGRSEIPPMFPKWEGYDISYGRYGARGLTDSYGWYGGWGSNDIVCIVQYMYHGDQFGYKMKYERIQQLRKERKNETTSEGDYPLFYYVPVKAYSDKDIVKKIIDKLHSPKCQQGRNINIETEDYLLLIGIDRKLNSQFIFRVPYKLAEDGYAITPRGKDKELYEILSSGLKEWENQKKAEKDRNDAIFRLFKQARESEKVDYKSLFLELKKLDALFGAKDPNELEQKMKGEKEGMRQMHGPEESKKKETAPIF